MGNGSLERLPALAAAPSPAPLGAATMSGMLWLLSGTLVVALCRVGVLVVYARLLDPHDFGIIAAVGIVVECGRLFAVSGINQVIVQRATLSELEINTAFTANMVSALVMAALLCALAGPVANLFGMPGAEPILWAASLIFPTLALSSISAKLLERDHAFARLARSDVATYIAAHLLAGIPLALAGAGVWSLVIAQILAAALRSLLLIRAHPHRLRPGFSVAAWREMMRTGWGYSMQRFANFVAMKGDYFVVGATLGPVALGFYERAYALMNISTSVIGSSLSTVLFPAFSRMNGDRDRQRAAYLRCLAAAALLFFPVSMVAIVLAPEIVGFLFGGKWDAIVLPFQILAAGMFFRNAYKVSQAVTDSNAWLYRGSVAHAVYAVCVVAGAWLAVGWGIAGVAFSTLAAILLLYLLLTMLAGRSCGCRAADLVAAIAPGFLAAAAGGLFCLAAATWLRGLGAPGLLVIAAASLAAALPLAALVLLVRSRRARLGATGILLVQVLDAIGRVRRSAAAKGAPWE